ncbi:unnamed protein product [Linum tenue]|uniref:BED-type domain-containing protein n=1 Tax=Linum tenue TaxID=586396 RepID=A0AAV0MCE9_9ROSI|nr:unnamed protein product [Linum tenue]
MASSTASVPGSKAKAKHKNAAGTRGDPGWDHGIDLDGNGVRVKCNYCQNEYKGGIYRLKNHLAGNKVNVEACLSVPDAVRNQFRELWDAKEEAKAKKKHLASGSDTEKQTTMSALLKKELRKKACKIISKWFYENVLPFNSSRSYTYPQMWKDVARHGPGFKPPSYHELRETFMKEEIKVVEEKLEIFKDEWKTMGCTIMSDGWTDRKRRCLCNFLANSPRGIVFIESVDTSDFPKTASKVFEMLDDIVEKVGEENVVQVVTDNASAYKAAGKLLMEKRKHLFWTPYAAHCIDLMLEDFEKHIKVHKSTITKGKKITNFIYVRPMLIAMMKEFTANKELVRAAVTRFATSYLTLGSLSENKGQLMTMFSSEKWRKSSFASIQEGKRVHGIVLDGRFWRDVTTCLRAALPLVKVLRLVDSDEKPAMPFLYFELTEAKEKIKKNFNNVESR